MSDNWIVLIPEDPTRIPSELQRDRARERLAEIASNAENIDIKLSAKNVFFDCGVNFERIRCPSCAAEIATKWWGERMADDYVNGGFRLARYSTPCCKASHTLHELQCEWPQGFGQFAIEMMNPDIGNVEDEHKKELEEILGMRLRIIYQHI
jgi:hypothetical protein